MNKLPSTVIMNNRNFSDLDEIADELTTMYECCVTSFRVKLMGHNKIKAYDILWDTTE